MERRTLVRPPLLVAAIVSLLPALASAQNEATLARKILEDAGVKGGLVVHLGCGDGKLTAALRASDSFLVHGLDRDPKNVQQARAYLLTQGIYGKVAVDRLTGKRLPYVDGMVNLIVVSKDEGLVPKAELMRVLAPGGVALPPRSSSLAPLRKPWPKEIDEWTHYLHDPSNNAVAHDSAIGPPRHVQWIGSPRWSRHHDHMASMSALVTAKGRLFYVVDEGSRKSIQMPARWAIVARDAFNGTILWKRSIPTWHTHLWPLKSGPAQLPRRLVAIDDTVYVTLGIDAPVTALDAATGKTLRTYDGTAGTEELIVSDGLLFAVCRSGPGELRAPKDTVANIKGHARSWTWQAPTRKVVAVDAGTGKALWGVDSAVTPLTLGADAERVYFHDGEKIHCVAKKSGEQKWMSEPLSRWSKLASYFGPTLVVYDGVVLFAGGESMVPHRGGQDTVTALDAATGKKLWTAEHPPGGYQSPEDLLVAGGLVWSGSTTNGKYSGVFQGRDPKTGELKAEFGPTVETYWFHHRCYRAKATDDYLLVSRTGIEFLDLDKKTWECHHWVRGGCLYGIMPANGLIYAPPHSCACYLVAKQYGFNALAAARRSEERGARSEEDRLERGPAWGQIAGPQSKIANPADWPTYRGGPARGGSTKTPVSTALKRAWEARLGGNLSSPVIAGGKVFIASVDTHTVHALNAATGAKAWSYTTGGRVDSPPTIYQGRVLFGSTDGWVYCLRASDGALAWRFRAAPEDDLVPAFEQIESAWPVHGSVLVQDDVVHCVAGRSLFLDGGLRLLRLDAKTGAKISETVLTDQDPEQKQNMQVHVQGLNMPTALPDVLSCDGKSVYMRAQRFDLQGQRTEIVTPRDAAQQKGEGEHLFCPTGFLDGSWFHRSYWVYGKTPLSGAGGYYRAGHFAPAGRIICFDDASIYGYGRKPQYFRWTTPMEYRLFATGRDYEVKRNKPEIRGCVQVPVTDSLNPTGKPLTVMAWAKSAQPNGVVVARGGNAQGYAIVLVKGKPQFMIRAAKKLTVLEADQRIGKGWVHLAGVLTAEKKLQLYIDGKLSASKDAPSLITGVPAQAMEIGADEGGAVGEYKSPNGLPGTIDEVRVYHRALTAEEIAQHCSAPNQVPAKAEGLVLYLSFDKDATTDGSGHNNHGTAAGIRAVKGKVGKAIRVAGRKKRGLGGKPSTEVVFKWSHNVPVIARAMVLADKTLFIAGPPDVVDEEEVYKTYGQEQTQAKLKEQDAAYQGAQGALLWAVSTTDGTKLAEWKLDSLPRWDGMAAAQGRLYIATTAGKVLCMAAR